MCNILLLLEIIFFYQVHHLQRVLSKKRDPVTQVCFINEYSKTNDAHLVNRHWESLTTALRDKLTHAASSELSLDIFIFIITAG